ncbi:MAG: 5-(carboxyamino)imidazole ribonucleotide mutase [Planctomycetota bacterium]
MLKPKVAIIMGSDSDLPVMQPAADILEQFEVPYEMTVVSAHRTPMRMVEFARTAHERGLEVIVAGAGGAAHLPGMVASITPLPVIGVPVKSSNSIDGWDSVLSILQMPGGVPVATVALNGARNAGLLAVEILSVADDTLRRRLLDYKQQLSDSVMEKVKRLESQRRSASSDEGTGQA